MANAFGVFQTYYATTLLTTSSQSSISWIGSIQGFLLLFVGVFCGRAFDAGYFYPVAGTGIFLSVFGMMMTSLGAKYYQIFLAQGLCLGLGSGFLFTPSISLVGTYFSTRRGLATGIAASGSSVGIHTPSPSHLSLPHQANLTSLQAESSSRSSSAASSKPPGSLGPCAPWPSSCSRHCSWESPY
jgi:hypothetical protein